MQLLPLVAAAVALGGSIGPASGEHHRAAAYAFRPLLDASTVVHLAAPRSAPGRLYVVEQQGRIRLAVNGKLRRKPFLDIRRLVDFGGERGLLAIAFHPAYARNGLVYVHYVAKGNTTRVVAYRATKDGTAALPKTARILFSLKQPGADHKGGQLAFGPDGKLYLGLGDGGCCDDPNNLAQNMSVLFGKLLRLDVAAQRPVPEIAALGLRNPWRFSFDRATGDLYLADVGAGLWEEVDYLPRAQLGELVNYGWDVYEGLVFKEEKPPSPQGRLLFPVHVYSHDENRCSITGGFVYRGSAVPEARGRYFYGDYCSGGIWSLRVVDGVATDVRREPITIPRLTTFGEDARGELYAARIGGRVYKLVRS